MSIRQLLRMSAAVAVLALIPSVHAATVVAPNANATALGGGGSTPGPLPANYGTTGSRYQEVFDAFNFSGFTASEAISRIAFRARTSQFAFAIGNSVTVSNVIITLSTTARTADFNSPNFISGQFSDNIGADVKTVYSGPLTLTSTAAPNSTAIDYVINLSSSFTYNKAAGNLLLDITVPDGSTTSGPGSIGYAPFDFASDNLITNDGVATAFGTGPAGPIGANSTSGTVTQFTSTAVPEPASLALISAAGIGLLRRRAR